MKFRDPKTGKVFYTIEKAQMQYCHRRSFCHTCLVETGRDDCIEFCRQNPAEAARLMGYEVIEDNVQKTFTETELLAVLDKLAYSCDSANVTGSITGDTLCDFHWKCGNANAVNFIKSALGIGQLEKTVKEANMEKKDKPRLAEVLGVEVGEKFAIKTYADDKPVFSVDETGIMRWDGAGFNNVIAIFTAINHPESIIRAPRLTEAELAICKAVGAKWVTRDDDTICPDVSLWGEKPVKQGHIYCSNATTLAFVGETLFPSVKPGDCICVEEVGGDEH